MGGGLGTTVTFLVAALLWLVYLAPGLRERHEDRLAERSARRIAATSRAMGIRPSAPLNHMSARELAEHRRELDRAARASERDARDAYQRHVRTVAPRAAARRRSSKLGLTVIALLSLTAGGLGVYFALWPVAAIAAGIAVLSIIGIVAVNTAPVVADRPRARRPVAAPAPRVEQPAGWTPVRTPPVRNTMPDGAGLIVTEEQTRAVLARERAERIRQQAAIAATGVAAVDPRFGASADTAPTEAETTGSMDISAALRARRAN